MKPRLLVLLGPPGSGKSFLAERCATRFDLDYVEHEALLLGRWGSLEAFAANKETALAEVEAGLRDRLASGTRTVVFESTGLSDRPMLERFQAATSVAVVRVVAPADLCVERVRMRPQGRHFVDSPEGAGRFHEFWTREVSPRWDCAATIVNDSHDEDATERHVERIGAIAKGVA